VATPEDIFTGGLNIAPVMKKGKIMSDKETRKKQCEKCGLQLRNEAARLNAG